MTKRFMTDQVNSYKNIECLQKLQKTGSISSMKHASFKGPILNNSFKIYKFQKTMQKPKKSMLLKYTYGTNETDLLF